MHQKGSCSNINVINRIQTKISPLSKRKQNSTSGDVKVASEGDSLKSNQIITLDDRQRQRGKSYGHQHHHAKDELDKRSLPNVKRHSITNSDSINQTLSSSNKILTSSHRLCRSSTTLNPLEIDVKSKPQQLHNKSPLECVALTAPILQTTQPLPSLRPAKSEAHTTSNQFCSTEKTTHAKERICYEKRLKKLEEEIERYKNEVKTFCRETFIYSKQKNNFFTKKDVHTNKQTNHSNSNPAGQSTPIKATCFQLLTKGNHHDVSKSDLDLPSGHNGGSDHFYHSFSGRSKEANKNVNNHTNLQRLQQNLHYPSAEHTQKEHHSRSLSKFT